MKLRLLCEGNWDGRIGRRDQCQGAAVIILKRVISASIGRPPIKEWEIDVDRLPKLTKLRGRGGLRRKVELAIKEAELDPHCDSLVVLVDRDRPEFKSKIREMSAALEGCADRAVAARTVVGMAVEEIEAWLIASSNPLGSDYPRISAAANPESQKDPKSLFHEMLADAGIALNQGYDLAAQSMNVAEVEAKCKAFKKFAAEVRQKLC